MNHWQAMRLDQLGTVERGRSRHRPRNDPSLYGGDYPFVQTGDVKAAGLRLFKYSQTYNEAGLAQSRIWPVGTLCFTIAANIGDTAILGIPACFPDSVVGFTPYPDKADVLFVKYALDYAKIRFGSISKGATQDNLSLEKLLSLDLLVPPVETQRRVAAILGAYDDLIEVNCRQIAALEEMARGLFTEWFVRLRFPGHEEVVIENTPAGPTPAGWSYEMLANVAAINAASLRPASAPVEIGYIDIASVSPGQIDSINRMAFSDAPGRARRRVRDGSILWSNVRPNRRSFALVLDPTPDIIASTGFTVLDAHEISFAYLYQWVTTAEFVGYLVGNAQGAAYPAVTSATFERAMMLLPPSDLVGRYTTFAEPILRLADQLQKSNANLTAARDLLLPRLISGQLSVIHAERELEDA